MEYWISELKNSKKLLINEWKSYKLRKFKIYLEN